MARRTKLTPEVQRRIVQAIKLGSTYALACQYAGISRATFFRWMAAGRQNHSPAKREFPDAVKEAEGGHALQTLATIHRAAKDGDWKAGAWLLERRHGYTRDGKASRPAPPAEEKVELSPLEQVQKARADAFASGSYVAGATLLREEARLKVELAQAERERQQVEAIGVDDAELMAEIVELISTLPDGARARVRALIDG